MRSEPTQPPLIETMLANLGRHGFAIEVVALNPAMTARPTGCITTLSFGERIEGEGADGVAAVEVTVDVRGDIRTNQLRRWRIARTYSLPGSGIRAASLVATLTLDGDVSANFVHREAKAGLAMIRTLISDVGVEVSRLPPPRRSIMPIKPVVYVKMKVAGEIAIGRSGLTRQRNGLQVATAEARLMCSSICDHLVSSIIPGLVAAAGAELREPHAVVPSSAGTRVSRGEKGAVL